MKITEEVHGLADTMRAMFTPPDYVPGCLVKSLADKDDYATNNGWIEAIVGPHGQQRVRYYGEPAGLVADTSLVDVEYFPAYRLYRVFGSTLGGTAVSGGAKVSSVWESDYGAVALQADTDGDIGIGTTSPDAQLEVLASSGAQLRITHTDSSKFADVTLDTNHDLTIKPSSTGQIILQPTTDSVDFFQVRDADGGVPVLNVDSTNEAVSVRTADTSFTFQGASAQVDFFLEGADVGASRTMAFRRQSDTASRGAQNAFLRARAGAAAVQSGDRVGTFNFEAHDGTDYNVGAQFGADIDGAVSANTTPMGFFVTTSPNNGGGIRYRFYITPNGDVAIGQTFTTPSAQLHVDQHDTTGAQPVLQVQQSDISEEIIWFEGESSAASADMSLVDAGDFTTPGALLGWIKNKVEDNRVGGLGTIDVWIPFYAIPTA